MTIRGRTASLAEAGFSIVELAVVLVIVALLIGGLIVPLTAQVEAARVKQTQRTLEEVRAAVLGFALRNDRLPCPALSGSNGAESRSDPNAGDGIDANVCDGAYGFVPARTLGLSGAFNEHQLLLDAWNNPVRYAISDATVGSTLTNPVDHPWDFVQAGQMRVVGLNQLAPDLVICSASPDAGTGSKNTLVGNCPAATRLATNAPVVFYSLGPNGAEINTATSLDEIENAGEDSDDRETSNFPGGDNFEIAADKVFVAGARSDTPGAGFDDLVDWISASELYYHMVKAGRLP